MSIPECITKYVVIPPNHEEPVISFCVSETGGNIERIGITAVPSTCNYHVFWTLCINKVPLNGFKRRPNPRSTMGNPETIKVPLPPRASIELSAFSNDDRANVGVEASIYVATTALLEKDTPPLENDLGSPSISKDAYLFRDENRMVIFHRPGKKDLRFETDKTKKPAACAELLWQLVTLGGEATSDDLQANNTTAYVYQNMRRLKEFLGREYNEWLSAPTKNGIIRLKKPIALPGVKREQTGTQITPNANI